MPDVRTILRSLGRERAVRNAERERREQARIHAQIDALARRLPACGVPRERKVS